MLPNLYIAGVPKGGTTALALLLSQHPEVFVPEKKEPRYFFFRDSPPEYIDPVNSNVIWEFDKYLKLYEGRNEKILIDGSGYIVNHRAIQSIRERNSSAKFIILLRDPVERAFSHFIFSQHKGFEPLNLDFADVLKNNSVELDNGFIRKRPYLEMGYYDRHLENFFKYYSPENIFIETSEKFKDFQSDVLIKIETFLEIDHYPFDFNIGHKAKSGLPRNKIINSLIQSTHKLRNLVPMELKTKGIKKYMKKIEDLNLRKPGMRDDIREELQELYKPSVRNLKEKFNVDISLWSNFRN